MTTTYPPRRHSDLGATGQGGRGGLVERRGRGHGPQPLTAPAVRPRMRLRWKASSSTRMSRAAITVPAITTLSSSTWPAERDFRPICTVRMSVSSVISRGQRYWFQAIRNENRPSAAMRSEEHTSELQSLMRISYAVFCLKKKKKNNIINNTHNE